MTTNNTLKFLPPAAVSAHEKLLLALGSEANPAQWMIFMQAVTQLLPEVLGGGRPSQDAINRSIIGQLGFKSWTSMIESPVDENGLGWNKSAWKAWRRAWSVIETNPWLANEKMTSSEVNQLAIKIKASQKDENGVIPDEDDLWFPTNKEELTAFIEKDKADRASKSESAAAVKATAQVKIESLEAEIKKAEAQIQSKSQIEIELKQATEQVHLSQDRLNEASLHAKSLESQILLAQKELKQAHADLDKSNQRVREYQSMGFLARLKALFSGH